MSHLIFWLTLLTTNILVESLSGTAQLTWYISYAPCCPANENYDPTADTTECTQYNACSYAGDFWAIGQKSFPYVQNNNLVAFYDASDPSGNNFMNNYGTREITLSKNGITFNATIADSCSNNDCGGCCTRNAQPSGFLIDIEYYTAINNFGSINDMDGEIQFSIGSAPPPPIIRGNIIITNVATTQSWWVAFYISNEDLSCGGTITNVEITDNNNYLNTWISYDSNQWGYYSFSTNGNAYTTPISVKITKTNNAISETIIAYNLISLTGDETFDFGSNFCQTSQSPSRTLTNSPSIAPTNNPSISPSKIPSLDPSETPTKNPFASPTKRPSDTPTKYPSISPSTMPSDNPTKNPVTSPSSNPSISPTKRPSDIPTKYPSISPSTMPSDNPTKNPFSSPSRDPSITPTKYPSINPTKYPSITPTKYPSISPTGSVSLNPTQTPTSNPSTTVSISPTKTPTINPSKILTFSPSKTPIAQPTVTPTTIPSNNPSNNPSSSPTIKPTKISTVQPSLNPIINTSNNPSTTPTLEPTYIPTNDPTLEPTLEPIYIPYNEPTLEPIYIPSNEPTLEPIYNPTNDPTLEPIYNPTNNPTLEPTLYPSQKSTSNPSKNPISTTNSPSNGNIIITNQADTQEWWVAFFISNEDLSCGGNISNVQITDNNNYEGIWISYDSNQWGYSFSTYGKAYTAPLSVKITKTHDGITENIIAYNLISLTCNETFDFGSNFCETGSGSKYTSNSPTLKPSQTPILTTSNTCYAIGVWEGDTAIDNWCVINCAAGNCPSNMCLCGLPTTTKTPSDITCNSIIDWNYEWEFNQTWNEYSMGNTYKSIAEEEFLSEYKQCGDYNEHILEYYYYFQTRNNNGLKIFMHICCGEYKSFGCCYNISNNYNKIYTPNQAIINHNPNSNYSHITVRQNRHKQSFVFGIKEYIIIGILCLIIICFSCAIIRIIKYYCDNKHKTILSSNANQAQMESVNVIPIHDLHSIPSVTNTNKSSDGSTITSIGFTSFI